MFRTKYQTRSVKTSMQKVKSLTDPQYMKDCSVEGIIKRYGVLPRPEVTPVGADVSEYGDFAICMERMNEALDRFAAMPSTIRERFGNDPRAFYAFITNPDNVDEAIKLGLMVKVEKEVTAVEVLEEIRDSVTQKGESQAQS